MGDDVVKAARVAQLAGRLQKAFGATNPRGFERAVELIGEFEAEARMRQQRQQMQAMRGIRSTHTYAVLPVNQSTFDDVKTRLLAADYGHAIDGEAIDMHGIALAVEVE